MSSIPQATIGGVQVGRIGYGLMALTWAAKQTADEQAFRAIKTAVDMGATFINSGEFYGTGRGTLNLELLSRFFEAEPTYADKIFLSVKGGLRPDFKPDSSIENLRRSVENINSILKHRKMDLFESARVDPDTPIEEAMKNLQILVKEGHFKHIGLSECSAATLRRAAAAGPVAAVEVEYSPWSLQIETNGILDACKELNIPIVAYSPLGKGFLTGAIKSRADIPEGDMRLTFDRFSEENFPINLELVSKLQSIAEKKGVSATKLALAWGLAQWKGIIPIPGSTRPEGVAESIEAAQVHLTSEDLKEIRDVLDSVTIIGGRYNAHLEANCEK